MNRRLASLLVLMGVLPGVSAVGFLPTAARAQTTRARTPAKAAQPAAPVPPAVPAPPPAYEYTFVTRQGPEEDLVELQRLGEEGWQVVATVVVDGSTRRYVLMRGKQAEPAPH
ncbi:hypothetical protein D7Y13_21695 [Corallococcus praedator]|uniref:DUF4177 domain-containing protein n=1 Tax=Corallococcus praedator TaxID=2316724 RepID=A0ABX9QFH0_9BACT|nr:MULTISPECIES: hypothetical protein [Corallococcus]RKH26204.1 hypothetical protein D7X75_28705 [Corallococcus sp. CA031C]RKI05810.1 hypothetical protein D7Y13_21695 [Corallococcus praedator]